MPSKATCQASDSQNQATPDAPLYAVVKNGQYALLDVQDTPCLTLTPEAQKALLAQTILDALDALPHRSLVLAEDFQAAADAYAVVMTDHMDHEAFMRAQEAFNKACRELFFGLHTMTKYSGF